MSSTSTLSCLICNSKSLDKGTSFNQKRSKLAKRKSKSVELIQITIPQCKIFCKALNIPVAHFSKRISNSNVCPECSKRVQNMTHIVTALEKLQDSVRLFRLEVVEMLEVSYDVEIKSKNPVEDGDDDDSLENTVNALRKEIIDLLTCWKNLHKSSLQKKKKRIISNLNPDLKIPRLTSEIISSYSKPFEEHDEDIGKVFSGTSQGLFDALGSEEEFCENSNSGLKDLNDMLPAPKLSSFSQGATSSKVIKAEPTEEDSKMSEFELGPSSPMNMEGTDDLGRLKEDNDAERLENTEDDYIPPDENAFAPNDSDDSYSGSDIAPPKRKKYSRGPRKSYNQILIPCGKCKCTFKTEFDLEIHTKRKHLGIKTPFACTFEGCKRRFRQRYIWKHHVEEHETGINALKKFPCEICGNLYDTNNSLQRHRSGHTGKWKYNCTQCDKGFHRPSELKVHVAKEHDAERHYPCEFCEEKFISSKLRIVHYSRVHPAEKLKINTTCEYCLKVFSGADALKCHKIQLHTGEYRFNCDVCKKGFAKKSWLVRHMLHHSMDKTYACDIDGCTEKFRFPNSLACHKMKHTGVYPFKCRVCGKKFLLRTQLNLHESTHGTEKNNICEYCGKTFNLALYLNHHTKRIHFKEIGLEAPPKYFMRDVERKRNKKKKTPKKTKGKKQSVKSDNETFDENETDPDLEFEDGVEVDSENVEVIYEEERQEEMEEEVVMEDIGSIETVQVIGMEEIQVDEVSGENNSEQFSIRVFVVDPK